MKPYNYAVEAMARCELDVRRLAKNIHDAHERGNTSLENSYRKQYVAEMEQNRIRLGVLVDIYEVSAATMFRDINNLADRMEGKRV